MPGIRERRILGGIRLLGRSSHPDALSSATNESARLRLVHINPRSAAVALTASSAEESIPVSWTRHKSAFWRARPRIINKIGKDVHRLFKKHTSILREKLRPPLQIAPLEGTRPPATSGEHTMYSTDSTDITRCPASAVAHITRLKQKSLIGRLIAKIVSWRIYAVGIIVLNYH